jgi:DNA-binding FadR family transcriptional regulator
MSNGELRASIQQMETWVADPGWEPNPEVLAQWDAEFHRALAQAEKGQDWGDLMAWAHAVGRQLEARTLQFAQVRDQMRAELDVYERGSRALRGYQPGVR